MTRPWSVTGLAIVAALLTVTPASAGDTLCTPLPGSTGFLTGSIEGDVVVPADGHCLLGLAHVNGNVRVEPRATLSVIRTTILGNLTAGLAGVRIWYSVLAGNVVLEGGWEHEVAFTEVRGSLELRYNTGYTNHATSTVVFGNIIVEGNSVFQTSLSGNTVGGNLVCKDNPAPVYSFGNVIHGNDECDAIRGAPPIGGI